MGAIFWYVIVPLVVLGTLIGLVLLSLKSQERERERKRAVRRANAAAIAQRLAFAPLPAGAERPHRLPILPGRAETEEIVRGIAEGHFVEVAVYDHGSSVAVHFARSPLPSGMSIRGETQWDYHRYEDYGSEVTGDTAFDELYAAGPIEAARRFSQALRDAFVRNHVPGTMFTDEEVLAFSRGVSQQLDLEETVALAKRLLSLVIVVEGAAEPK
jgi:hypothetical protein